MIDSIRYALADTWVITWRNLLKYKRVPRLLIFSTVQPLMLLLLFNYVFGGALRLPEGVDSYINYLLPGLMVQIVLFGVTQATISMADDLNKGIISRFKTLPMSHMAVVAGRALADMARNAVVLTMMLILGVIIGFSFVNGIFFGICGVLLALLFSFAMSWISITIGLLARDPESAQAAGFIWVFPLAFASSIFVPVSTMPSWLQGFAANQPVSVVATAVRSLMIGGPHDKLLPAIIWSVGIFIVFAWIATRLFGKRT